MSDTTRKGCQAMMVEMLDDQGLEFTLAALSGALRFKANQLDDHDQGLSVTTPWLVAAGEVAGLKVDLRYLKL